MGFSSWLSFGIEHAGPFQTDELIECQILEAVAARFLYKFRGDALDLRADGFIDVYFEAGRLQCFQIVRGDALHLQAHKFRLRISRMYSGVTPCTFIPMISSASAFSPRSRTCLI